MVDLRALLGLSPPGLAQGIRRANIGRLVSLGKRNAEMARSTALVTRNWIRSYANPTSFQKDWKWLRLDVDLQTRLFVEQVLWELGGDYRTLVTGFGPVKGVVGKKLGPAAAAQRKKIEGRRAPRQTGKRRSGGR